MDTDNLFSAGTRADQVPIADAARQAVASLGGYAYQVLAAALAWIDIDENSRLFLEVAEDYATVAESAIRAVQVKDTRGSGSVTLNSASIRNAVAAFVDLAEKNPDVQVNLRFFTTSEIGRERTYADGIADVPGLIYWGKVAGTSPASPAPLRSVLESDAFPSSARNFSKARNDSELCRDLIEKINWDCGRPDYSTLRHELEERLVVVGRDLFHLPADEARPLADQIIYRVLTKSTATTPSERVLTRAELYRTIDAASRSSVPRVSVDALTRLASNLATSFQEDKKPSKSLVAAETGWLVDGTMLPAPRGLIARPAIESKVDAALKNLGAAVLVGGSGLGKSTLSRSVASARAHLFMIAEFRNTDAAETRLRLDTLFARLGGLPSSLLILDDVNDFDDAYVRLSLARVVEASRRRNRDLLITCYRAPSPTVLTQLDIPPDCVINCRYFSENDAHALVRSNGGDPSTWGRLAYITGGHGHPQLTHAFIAGMAARNWPVHEIDDVFHSGLSSGDIDATREAARRNLVSALPEGARTLLYRLSISIGHFDRSLALKIGTLSPPVPQAGECMDKLIGPWIECTGKDQFRVSPLAGHFGRELLHLDQQRTIHNTIAGHMLQGQTLSAAEVDTILAHAIAGRSRSSLLTLAHSISTTDTQTIEKLAEHLFLFRVFRTTAPIYPDDQFVSGILRIAQFKLLVATRESSRIQNVATALFDEIRNMPKGRPRDGLEALALMNVLGTMGIANHLDDWISLLLEFEKLFDVNEALRDLLPELTGAADAMGTNIFGGLFSVGSANLASVDKLEHIVNELDKLDASTRGMLLTPLDSTSADYSALLNGPWAMHERSDAFDSAHALACYRKMAKTTGTWATRTWALQCWAAQAILLDEFQNNSDGALATLREAIADLGEDIVLLRARAKVYSRRHEYGEALAIFRNISDSVGGGNPVETAFALRDAAISAAECQEWSLAEEWFASARSAAKRAALGDMNVMAVGLGADSAAAALKGGRVDHALRGLADTLKELTDIDPETTLRGAHCHRVIRHAVLWANAYITAADVMVDSQPIRLAPGVCSNPEPLPAIRDLPLGHIDIAWYLLADAETASGLNVGISDTLTDYLTSGMIPSMEVNLRKRALESHLDRLDARGFAIHLMPYLESVVHVVREDQSDERSTKFSPTAPERGQIPALDVSVPFSPLTERFGTEAILAYGIRSTLAGRPAGMNELESALEEQLAGGFPGELIFNRSNHTSTLPLEHDSNVVEVVRKLVLSKHVTPDEFWMAGLRFFEWIDRSSFKDLLMIRLAAWLRSGWLRILSEELFRLSRPRQTVPPIRDVLTTHVDGRGFIAKLTVVSSDAVGSRLSLEYRNILETVARENSVQDAHSRG